MVRKRSSMKTNKVIKYEHIQGDQNTPFKIIHIKIGSEHPGVDMHWHRSLEFIVPKTGVAEVWKNGQAKLIYPGDFEFVHSKDIHECRNGAPGQGYEGYCIQMRYDFFKENGVDFLEYSFDETKLSKWFLHELLNEIVKTYEKEGENRYRFLGLAYLLVDELLKCATQTMPISQIESDKYRDLMVDILGYIEDHSFQNLTATEIAREFNLSYGYLARLFNKYLGISITGAITAVRLEKARQELLDSDLSIIKIALSEGFPNVKSFEREFKKQYGVTPVNYRKKRG